MLRDHVLEFQAAISAIEVPISTHLFMSRPSLSDLVMIHVGVRKTGHRSDPWYLLWTGDRHHLCM